ncbi:MAG TPA: GNAT family N-acetyltransferase [Burkholderiales bacterium]|nr:GNAT family N-acetyltransferase [Burkholderiales bacterium]
MEWNQARERASPIRFEVFVREQRVPAEIELDDMDARCLHALAFHHESVVGTGRLLPDGHIGRMAVLKDYRGKGVGAAMLMRLIEAARARGDREVALSAQVHAVPFYRAHGFVEEGEEYEEAGIAHQAMRRIL